MKSELLKAFVTVAEQRSFTRAATVLHLTQSAMSMQVKRLECSLGVELFHRSARRVELSAAGCKLLNYARRILALNDEAVLQVSTAPEEGTLRIGVMEDYGGLVLHPTLMRLGAAAPGATVEVVTGLTSLMLERLGTDYDVVIAMHAAGYGGGVFLRTEQAVWAAGPGYQVSASDTLELALYRPGCLLRAWATEALDAVGRPWRLSFVGESSGAVQAIAAKSKMLTVAKSSMFPRPLRPIGAGHGLPRLPAGEVRLHRSPRLPRSAGIFTDRLIKELQASPL